MMKRVKRFLLSVLLPLCGAVLFLACPADVGVVPDSIPSKLASVEIPENGTIVVSLLENPGRAPQAGDFSFKQNINGEEEWTAVEGVTLVSWDPATLTAVFSFNPFPYLNDEPVLAIRVKAKSQSDVHAQTLLFVVPKETAPVPLVIDSVGAINGIAAYPVGTISITLNQNPVGRKVSDADFIVKKYVDGGSAEDIDGLIWDSYSRSTKTAVFNFTQMGNAGASPISVVIGVTVIETEQQERAPAFTVSAGTTPGVAPERLNKEFLTEKIDAAEAELAAVKISADGLDVVSTKKYVTQAEADAFRAEIDAAETVLQYGITQAAIDAAAAVIAGQTAAFQGLQKNGTMPPPNKTALNTAITDANTLKNTTDVAGNGNNVLITRYWVTQTVMNTFTAAIAAAQACSLSDSVFQAEVDDAKDDLITATAAFNAARALGSYAPPDKGPLEAAMTAAESLRNATTIAASGALVPTTSWWVTQSVYDAFNSAIAVAHNPGWYQTTGAGLEAARQALLTAQGVFTANRSQGTMIPDDGNDSAGVPAGKVLKPGYVTIAGATACCTHASDGQGIPALFDDNLSTYWHNDWSKSAAAAHPDSPYHWITLDLGAGFSGELGQIEYYPRNGNGRIYRAAAYVSDSPLGDTPPDAALVKASGPWAYPTNATKYINFPAGITGRYIQVRWLEGQGGVASAIEFKVRELKNEPPGVLPLTFPSPLDDLDIDMSPTGIFACCWHSGDGPEKLIDGNTGNMWDFAWGGGDRTSSNSHYHAQGLTTTADYGGNGHVSDLGGQKAHFVTFDLGAVVPNIYELAWFSRDGNGDFWAYEVWAGNADPGINPAVTPNGAMKVADLSYAEAQADSTKRIAGYKWNYIPLATPVSAQYIQVRILEDSYPNGELQAAGREFKLNSLGAGAAFAIDDTALSETLNGAGLAAAVSGLTGAAKTTLDGKVITAQGYITAAPSITDVIQKINHQKLMDAITRDIRQIVMDYLATL